MAVYSSAKGTGPKSVRRRIDTEQTSFSIALNAFTVGMGEKHGRFDRYIDV